jgi:hypothetical protein
MPTISHDYSTVQTVTISLAGLAHGSYRQSAVIDNTTNKYIDASLGVSIQVGTTPTSGATIDIYAYGTIDGSIYTGGASGSDASYAVGNNAEELRFLMSANVGATSDLDYIFGPASVAQAFGGVLPPKWGIIVRNNTGQTLHATGTNNAVKFYGIKYASA